MRKRLSLEISILTFCCVGLLATGGLLLFYDRSFYSGSATGQSIGSVHPVGSDIRVKGEVERSWNPVARNSSVFQNDRLYTGPNSKAEVTLKNDEKITIEPNSLIIVTYEDDQTTELSGGGGFFASLKKGLNVLTKTDGDESQLSLFAAPKPQLKLVVLKGEASLQKDEASEPQKISVQPKLETDPVKPISVTPAYKLIQPQPGGEKWVQNTKVDFEWENTPAGQTSKIEVSTDPEFEQIVASGEAASNHLNLELPAATTYFWRVSTPDSQSVVSSFSLQTMTPPQVAPFTEVSVNIDADNRSLESVHLTWTDSMNSQSYDLEIATEPDFRSILEARKTLSTSASIPNLAMGRYYWRIQARSPGRSPLTSNTGELHVKMKERILPQVLAELPKAREESPKAPEVEVVAATESDPAIPLAIEPPVQVETQANPVEVPQVRTEVKPKPPVLANLLTPRPLPEVRSSERTPSAIPEDTETASSTPLDFEKLRTNTPVNYWLWAGSGYNYQSYQQSIPIFDGSAKFKNIQGPSAVLRGGFARGLWGFDASYTATPGKMASSNLITVTNGTYTWQTLSAEGLYKFQDLLNFRFGLQYHVMPFMVLDPGSSNIDITANTLTLATLGLNRSFPIIPKLRAEWLMRYQHPLMAGSSNGASFNVNPKFAFDGSLGGVYDLGDQSRLGLYWYGQWHEYNFSYNSESLSFSGAQTLFYSNVEMRFGFEF